ncbi:MAG TPA: type VI secretion system-associated FHA domain protein TagH [Steroidobacteraceae bacterium]|nr:type VI secretion system-associated FHA domain protein TagH [Steroidobacteraceae bacterium]
MYLTFEVMSANAASLGSARRKVFTVEGGRIGRAPENDMVLPGVGVHRHHATVRFINGVFFVEGVGTNGIAINNPEVVLPRNEPYPLKTGDKVFIDEYEIVVTASAAAPAEPAAARQPERVALRPGPQLGGAGDRPIAPLFSESDDSAEDLDPLRKLMGGAGASASRRPEPSSDASWNHTSSLSDHFAPPAANTVPGAGNLAGAGAANVIPENWDRTSFDRSKLQPQSRPPSAPASAAPRAPASPPPQQHQPAPHDQPSPSSPRPQPPPSSSQRPQTPAPPPRTAAQQVAGTNTSGAHFDWEGFLRAANVDPARVPPETAAMLGNIMRSVVQGLIEVLRARSEIKTEFRMPVTQVKVSENNPLKFAANAEDALGNLLGRRNSAYLPPQEAFDDAFNDVRFHQLAMLAGVRAGFDNLMNRFDPAQLQEGFERQGKRGLFGGGGKATYWERYAERFQEMSKDRDETFRRLFGEEFARAYEQQLSVLKRGRKDNP